MSRMDPAAIRATVADLDRRVGWYQDIDLGDGIRTKTRVIWGESIDHPRQRWQMIADHVPTDMSGMRVLDVGCNAGFIALEAAARGAQYVLGVDTNAGYIEQARFCAEVTGSSAEFERISVYNLNRLEEPFDFVFFVGLLYHCRDLPLAIRRVSQATKHTLVVESAIDPSPTEIPYVRFIRTSLYGGPKSQGDARLPGHWHPNMAALQALFLEEGFSSVEPIAKLGGRGAVLAHR